MKPDNTMNLKTSPEKFADQAAAVADRIGEVVKALDGLEAVILRTSHYWVGEAGDYYRVLYGENREEIREMMQRLSTQPEKLLQMAGMEDKSSKECELSTPLPADVL